MSHEARQAPSWLIFDVRQKMHAAKAKRTAIAVIECFAAADYERLLRIAPTSRVNAGDLRKVVAAYGRRPIMPSAPIEELMDVVEVRGSQPKSWSVNLPLWTEEEGRSDLTLEMHFTESEAELYAVEIDDLHIL